MKKFKEKVDISTGKAAQTTGNILQSKELTNKKMPLKNKGKRQKIEAEIQKRLRHTALMVGKKIEKMGGRIAHIAD